MVLRSAGWAVLMAVLPSSVAGTDWSTETWEKGSSDHHRGCQPESRSPAGAQRNIQLALTVRLGRFRLMLTSIKMLQ